MSWIFIVLAGLLEVLVVLGIRMLALKKYFHGIVLYGMALSTSIYFLHLAMKSVDASVAYAAYTGIGVMGTVLSGILFWGERKSRKKIVCVFLITCSVIMLKMSDKKIPAQLRRISDNCLITSCSASLKYILGFGANRNGAGTSPQYYSQCYE